VSSGVERASASGGDVLWRFDMGGVDADGRQYYDALVSWRSSPTVVDGVVYQGWLDGNLYAIDSSTGELLWEFQTGDWIVSSPMVKGNTVYVGSSNGLYAVNTGDGTERWKLSLPRDDEFSRPRFSSSPIATDDVVYAASTNGVLYALDTSNGEEFWRYTITGAFWSSPTLRDGILYIGSKTDSGQLSGATGQGSPEVTYGNLHAVDASKGVEEWRYIDRQKSLSERPEPKDLNTLRDGVYWSPTVSEGSVYTGRPAMSIDIQNGSVNWVFEGGDYISSPTKVGSTILAGSEELFAVDASYEGDTRQYEEPAQWSHSLGSESVSSPTVAGDKVFVGSNQGIHSIGLSDGTDAWSMTEVGRVSSSPVVVDGTVYFASDDGILYAMDAGVAGSSRDSRVKIGTLGHHDAWAERDIEVDVVRDAGDVGEEEGDANGDEPDEVDTTSEGNRSDGTEGENLSWGLAPPLTALLSGYLYRRRERDEDGSNENSTHRP